MNEVEIRSQDRHPPLKVTLIVLLVSFIFIALFGFFSVQSMGKIQLMLGQIVFFLPGLSLVLLRKYPVARVFRLRKIGKRLLGCSLLLGLSVPLLVDELDRLIGRFIEIPPEFEEFLATVLVANSMSDWVVLFLGAVILAGITEEVLFRGLLQQALEHRFGGINAIFFSALLFALFHGVPGWLLQIFMLGSLLGYLSWRSNSVLPGILMHCINNLYALLYANFSPQAFNWYQWHDHVNPPILAVSACIAFYSFKWFQRLTITK